MRPLMSAETNKFENEVSLSKLVGAFGAQPRTPLGVQPPQALLQRTEPTSLKDLHYHWCSPTADQQHYFSDVSDFCHRLAKRKIP